jgi:hypothetical protein
MFRSQQKMTLTFTLGNTAVGVTAGGIHALAGLKGEACNPALRATIFLR